MAYSSISKSTDYFSVKTYAGNNGSQSITGVGHQPDWILSLIHISEPTRPY